MVLQKSQADFSIVRRRFKQNTGAADAEKYIFYGQHYPQLDEFLFKRYFSDVNFRGVFIECGANDGYAGSNCKFFEDSLGWTGYNIEPAPETFALLEKKRPNCRNVNLALSNVCGKADFAITVPEDDNPAYHGAVNRMMGTEIAGGVTVAGCNYIIREVVQVPTLTYKRFVHDNKIPGVDLFVLDTEGHEEEVIEGMTGSSVLPALLCVENGYTDNIRTLLAELGYVFDREHFGNHCWLRKDMSDSFARRLLPENM